MKRALVLFALCAAYPVLSSCQASQKTGIEILQQAVIAAGGREACAQVAAFHASGEFSIFSNGEVTDSGNASLAGSGLDKFHLTANLSNDVRTLIWNDHEGWFASRKEGTERIGRHNIQVLQGLTSPAQKIINALLNTSYSVQLIEVTTLEDKPVYRVRIAGTEMARGQRNISEPAALTTDVLIDKTTFLVLAVQDTIFPNDNTRSRFQHTVQYSDYRVIAGAQVPFLIREQISGQLTWQLQLTSFEPAAQVADGEFSLQ